MFQQNKKIVLVGGGGHCKSCIEVIESTQKYDIIGILDLPSEYGKKILGYEVIGNDDDYLKFHNKGFSFLVTVGQTKSVKLKKRIFNQLEKINANIETVIASTAYVSKHCKIGKGTIVMQNAFVNSDTVIGDNCILNTGCIIEHDSKISDHTHISTNAVLNGACALGKEIFVGSHVCISNNISIASNVIIGAGSTVIKNIKESGTYVGVPAKKIK